MKQLYPIFDMLLRLVVAVEIAIYFGAALLHLGIPIKLGTLVLAVPNAIVPATIVETILGLAITANLAILLFAQRPSTQTTIGIHIFVLAGILFGMVSLALFIGPPPGPDWNLHYVMLAGILAAIILTLLQHKA